MSSEKELKNKQYLESLLGSDNNDSSQKPKEVIVNNNYTPPSAEYSLIDINLLPAGRFYKPGTKISIRASKVSEIQAYSVVDDNNFVDITEKMNELLSRNIMFVYPDGKKGTYKDVKDADRMFIIFMIRELTFQGGNTLTKEVQCPSCNNEFSIPFRATSNNSGPATFELQQPKEEIERFWKPDDNCYELIHQGVSWKLGPPTIGIQEDFYDEIKRNVQADKKPNVSFMKIMPFLLYDRSFITPEGMKAKLKEYVNMDDLTLFSGLNAIVNNMTLGIKGLTMKCNECGEEVHTELTFPGGASTLFELPSILDSFTR
jgi:hypothetical protein